MYHTLRHVLFLLPAETSHNIALFGLSLLNKIGLLGLMEPKQDKQSVTVMGLQFKNRIGLAAGLDKNGKHVHALSKLGFGFLEVGTVTPLPQRGNPKPRIFRIRSENAIINRMGFNNAGIDQLIENITLARDAGFTGIIGINIGKNRDTTPENAIEDYLIGLRQAYRYADYITLNVSSPNTPGLRDLQYGKELDKLLGRIKAEQMKLSLEFKQYKPIAIKVAPDLDDNAIEAIAKTVLKHSMDALIACNTTVSREKVRGKANATEKGGLSGAPVREDSTKVIAKFNKYLHNQIPIIGVGGIASAADAKEKFAAGAELVQVYTGLIYEGPGLIKKIIKDTY